MISLETVIQIASAVVESVFVEVMASLTRRSLGDESVHRDSTPGTVPAFGSDGIPVAVPFDRTPFVKLQTRGGGPVNDHDPPQGQRY